MWRCPSQRHNLRDAIHRKGPFLTVFYYYLNVSFVTAHKIPVVWLPYVSISDRVFRIF